MSKEADISILGCGWLGLPVAEKLVNKGYRVKGSTTSPEKMPLLAEKGIQPYLVNLQDEVAVKETLPDFLDAKVLLLNIPPRLRSDGGAAYLSQLSILRHALLSSPVNRVIFISSTSVYPDLNRTVTEEDSSFMPASDPANMLLQAEAFFQERNEWMTTVVRFAGLVGGERKPGRFFAGKKDVPNGDAPVNVIHLDDCVAIILRLLEQDNWGQVYNACADSHPSRRDFYSGAAVALGLEAPQFIDMSETKFKLIKSQKLKDELAYSFLHPDPMGFF